MTAAEVLRAVGTGDVDEVRRILATDPSLVNATGPHPFWGGQPQSLHVAVETNRREIFDLLLEAGADVSGRNDEYDGWSPLMLCVQHGREEMRDELIRRGAEVRLVEALMLGDDARVDMLLRERGLPRAVPNSASLLSFARTVLAIDRLLALGVRADLRDRLGSAPVDALSRLGVRGRPLLRHLAERGVAVAPEHYARVGDRAALEGLDASVVRSGSVFVAAVEFGDTAMVRWLLAVGADVNSRSGPPSFHTALHCAGWNGDLEMARVLVGAGADKGARDRQHNGTPRDWAEAAVMVRNNARCAVVAEYLLRGEL